VTVEELSRSQCHPKVVGLLETNLQEACGAVYAQSLQSAILITASLYAVCSLFFLLTWPRLKKDMVDRNPRT